MLAAAAWKCAFICKRLNKSRRVSLMYTLEIRCKNFDVKWMQTVKWRWPNVCFQASYCKNKFAKGQCKISPSYKWSDCDSDQKTPMPSETYKYTKFDLFWADYLFDGKWACIPCNVFNDCNNPETMMCNDRLINGKHQLSVDSQRIPSKTAMGCKCPLV